MNAQTARGEKNYHRGCQALGSAHSASPANRRLAVPKSELLLDVPPAVLTSLRQHWQLTSVVAIYFILHLYVLSFTNDFIWDERFWVPEARHILNREALEWAGYPHLGKLFVALGIWSLGDNSLGMRLPSVLFGAMGVALVYLIALNLAGKRTAVLASVLYAFENLAFTMSGLAMLDTIALPFMLLSFWLYLKKRYALAGVSLALGTLCSAKVVLGVLAIVGHWVLVRRKQGFRSIAVFAVISLASFLILLPATDALATGQWLNPFGRIGHMWTDQTSVKLSELTPEEIAYSRPSRPWEWISQVGGIHCEPANLRYFLQITPTIWLLIIPSMTYLVYRYFRVSKYRAAPRFILLWFGAAYLTWIPIELLTDRTMFIYYFFPTVGAVCIAIAYAIYRAWEKSAQMKRRNLRRVTRALLVSYLVVNLLTFVVFSPLPAGLGL